MKPWLLNILACPVDKHHPLDTRFFSWKNSEPRSYSPEELDGLRKQFLDGTISVPALNEIWDQTENSYTVELLVNIKRFIASDMVEDNLGVIYQYLNTFDVESGVLRCPECGRWYPIGSSVSGIPELLPDHFRNTENDAAFLEKWKDKLGEIGIE